MRRRTRMLSGTTAARRASLAVLSMVISVAAWAPVGAHAAPVSDPISAIVVLRGPIVGAHMTAVLEDLLGRVPGVVVEDRFEALPMFVARGDAASLDALRADPRVASVAPNRVHRRSLKDSLGVIKQPQVAAQGFTGTGTSIAVLDSGVDFTHEDLGSCEAAGDPGCRVVFAEDFAPEDFMNDDQLRHGTNVAAIAAAVAPGAGIVALDVFSVDFGADADILEALDWVLVNHETYGIAAANLSLGDDSYYTDACDGRLEAYAVAFEALREVGVVPVVAAGNDAFPRGSFVDGMNSPACVSSAVSVGAVYDADEGRQRWGNECTDESGPGVKVCWSQTSRNLTIYAPGAFIRAGGREMAGTSQATPHVAGAVAVLRSAAPDASADEIVAALRTSPTDVIEPETGRSVPLLDLEAAVRAIGGRPPREVDLSVGVEVVGRDGVVQSGEVTLDVTLTNAGPGPAKRAVAAISLDALKRHSGRTSVRSTATPSSVVTCSEADGQLRCPFGALPPGASRTLRLELLAAPGVSDTLDVTVVASARGTDVAPDNDVTTLSIPIALDCTVLGTPGDDVLQGTAGPDVICGLDGDDILVGLDGDDVLVGGDGLDAADYSAATGPITARLGRGTVGGVGLDSLDSLEGVVGGASDDVLRGGRYGDVLLGGAGDDVLRGGGGDDAIDGGVGDDTVVGDAGDDVLFGGDGNDRIEGSEGTDACSQGKGFGTVVGCEQRARRSAPVTYPVAPEAWIGRRA